MDMLRVQVAPLYLCHPFGNFLKSVAELGLYGGDAILAMTVTGRGRRTEDGGWRTEDFVGCKDERSLVSPSSIYMHSPLSAINDRDLSSHLCRGFVP